MTLFHPILLIALCALAACSTPSPPAPIAMSSLSTVPDAATLMNFYGSDRKNRLSLLDTGPCEKQADGRHMRTTYATPVFVHDGRQRATEVRIKPNVPVTLAYYSEMSSTNCSIAVTFMLLPNGRYDVLNTPVGHGRCDLQIVDATSKRPLTLLPAATQAGEHACAAPL